MASSRTTTARYFIQTDEPGIKFFPIGLIGLFLILFPLIYGLTHFARTDIEDKVTLEVGGALSDAGFEHIEVDVSGQHVLLSGLASKEDGVRAVSIAKAALGLTWLGEKHASVSVEGNFDRPKEKLVMKESVVEKPIVRQWGWLEAIVDTDLLIIKGQVGSVKEKKALIESARSFGRVDENIEVISTNILSGSAILARRVMTGVNRCSSGRIKSENGVFSMDCQVPRGQADDIRKWASSPIKGAKIGVVLVRVSNDCEKAFTQKLEKSTIRFSVGSAELKSGSATILNDIASIIESCAARVRVEGHTDNTGSFDVNLKLSQARAESVVVALVARGIKKQDLLPKGYGPSKPKVAGDDAEARQKNRRIEFYVINEEAKQ